VEGHAPEQVRRPWAALARSTVEGLVRSLAGTLTITGSTIAGVVQGSDRNRAVTLTITGDHLAGIDIEDQFGDVSGLIARNVVTGDVTVIRFSTATGRSVITVRGDVIGGSVDASAPADVISRRNVIGGSCNALQC
jgi:hypothetical protein